MQRLLSARPELKGRSLVLHSAQPRGSVVALCSEAAARQGVAPGMPLAEASGLATNAIFLPFDPLADRDALTNLARHCHRFTPRVALEDGDAPEALLLDIAGCAHLFGGEERLIRLVQDELRGLHFVTRPAVADTTGSAWALARYGAASTRLRDLPVAALRLPDEVLCKLRRLGLATVGQVSALPRSTLPSRFGRVLLERLDQFTGRSPEIVRLVAPPEPIIAAWTFDDPVSDRRALESVVFRLLAEVTAELLHRRQATQRVRCEFGMTRKQSATLALQLTRPTASIEHLQELAAIQLERFTWPGELTRVRVEAQPLPPPLPRERTLFEQAGDRHEHHLAALLDRLRSRCGEETVRWASLVDDWLPERSVAYRAHGDRSQGRPIGPVPLRLYRMPVALEAVTHQDRPVRLRWNRHEERVTDSIGPHRIETGWWRRQFVRRDYYRIVTVGGRRLWLFQERASRAWFVCGE